MFKLNDAPPSSEVRPVTDVIHGESITDSYRWLEEQDSGPTRDWIKRQTLYARHYLDNVEGQNVFGPGFASYSPLKRMTHCEWRRAATSFVSVFPSRNSHAFICAMAPTAKIVFSSTRAAGRRDTTRR